MSAPGQEVVPRRRRERSQRSEHLDLARHRRESFLCHSGVMWITELATNTMTAATTIGSQSEAMLTMGSPRCLVDRSPRPAQARRRHFAPNAQRSPQRRRTAAAALEPAAGRSRRRAALSLLPRSNRARAGRRPEPQAWQFLHPQRGPAALRRRTRAPAEGAQALVCNGPPQGPVGRISGSLALQVGVTAEECPSNLPEIE